MRNRDEDMELKPAVDEAEVSTDEEMADLDTPDEALDELDIEIADEDEDEEEAGLEVEEQAEATEQVSMHRGDFSDRDICKSLPTCFTCQVQTTD